MNIRIKILPISLETLLVWYDFRSHGDANIELTYFPVLTELQVTILVQFLFILLFINDHTCSRTFKQL